MVTFILGVAAVELCMLAGRPRICMLVQLTACLVKTVVWFSFCGGLHLQNHGVCWPVKLLLFRHVSCAFKTKVKTEHPGLAHNRTENILRRMCKACCPCL